MTPGAVPGIFGLLALAGLLAGPVAFAAVVLVMALVTLLDLSVLLRREGASPIVPAALVPGLALPVRLAVGDGPGWESIPEFAAIGFFAAMFLALLFGRRTRVTEALGATLTTGLVVGVGAGALLLLRDLAGGFRWTLGLILLVSAAGLGAPVARRLAGRSSSHLDGATGGSGPVGIGPAAALPGAAAMAVIAVLTLAPPFDEALAAMFAVIALLGVLGAQEWHLTPVPRAKPPARRLLGSGAVVAASSALFLAAPLAYLVARTAAV